MHAGGRAVHNASEQGENRMAKVTFRDKEWEVPGGKTVKEIIEDLGLDPESVLAVRDGKLINEETVVEEDDTIKLLAVISGGSG